MFKSQFVNVIKKVVTKGMNIKWVYCNPPFLSLALELRVWTSSVALAFVLECHLHVAIAHAMSTKQIRFRALDGWMDVLSTDSSIHLHAIWSQCFVIN